MKPKNHPIVLASRAQFDAAIDDIATLQTQARKLEAVRDARIQEIQQEFGAKLQPLELALDARLSAAEAYALAHRDEVLAPGRQSGETSTATYSFRVHPPALVPLNRRWKWDTILEAVRQRFGLRFIRTEESLAKDEMKAHLGDSDLASVGLRVQQKETFSVEPKVDGGEPETAAARDQA